MADIYMCKDGECPTKESCYRFNAIPSPEVQKWVNSTFNRGREINCLNYWPIKPNKNKGIIKW